MKIKLTRANFIRQFPFLRIPILEQIEDDYVFIEGEEMFQKKHPLLEKYPSFFELFTARELEFLKEMYGKQFGATRNELARFVHSMRDRSTPAYSNAIDCHMKNIRTKLMKQNLPFRIIAHRGKGYQLEELIS